MEMGAVQLDSKHFVPKQSFFCMLQQKEDGKANFATSAEREQGSDTSAVCDPAARACSDMVTSCGQEKHLTSRKT